MCLKNILKHRVTKHFKQLLKGVAKKVQPSMKIQTFKIFNFETNQFTEWLKQTRKRRYDVIYNVELLLILKYERHPKGERFVDENEIS